MSEAWFALAGALIGLLGSLGTDLLRGRREDRKHQEAQLRSTFAEYAAAIAEIKAVAFEVSRTPEDELLRSRIYDSHMTARSILERLRLTSASMGVQEAARYALRYAYGLLRLAQGREPRPDEQDRHPVQLLDQWFTTLLIEMRKDLGLRHPDRVFPERAEWVVFPQAERSGEPDVPA
ncbi:hypothetical protein DFJ67_5223 [Asanoa ferruginea]|uniref:Uncharacterized protein n=1 Tax=Asanoa ferruginea TaxID=53367 RepID=A0A3D9ZP97_9ACTN|nr:hypothetical protein [Asanoa ferruginea]REF99196.1 hypothetical protein DFJ67_5223 [Asanoa ferruginea]GIF45788.1 hypothetical protein Afe04nite_03270 [Asanoa ferruginea]